MTALDTQPSILIQVLHEKSDVTSVFGVMLYVSVINLCWLGWLLTVLTTMIVDGGVMTVDSAIVLRSMIQQLPCFDIPTYVPFLSVRVCAT